MKSIAATVVALSLSGLLAGCTGGGDDPAAAHDSSTSPSASGEPSATPTVEPATGDLLKQPSATMHAPDGWKHRPDVVPYQDTVGDNDGPDIVNMYEMPGWQGGTLDQAAQNSLDGKTVKPLPERLADAELDGLPAYHLAGPRDPHAVVDEYGALYHDHVIIVEFSLSNGSKAERQRLIDASLATFRWR